MRPSMRDPLPDDFPQQPLRLILQHENVGTDFVERAERLGLVEVAVEIDFVADLGFRLVDPGVRNIGAGLRGG